MSEPPFPHQYEAVEKFHEMQKNDATIADLISWLYSENWYFQTESEAWDDTTLYYHTSLNNLDALLVDLKEAISYDKNVRFVITDTYIDFRSKSMNPKMAVLLKHGKNSIEYNDWPNNIIKKNIGLTRRYDAINKRKI